MLQRIGEQIAGLLARCDEILAERDKSQACTCKTWSSYYAKPQSEKSGWHGPTCPMYIEGLD